MSLPPWHCVSWFARIVSVACWIFIALAGLCALTAKREEKSVAGLLLFFALGLNALLSFATAGAVELSPTAAHVVEIPPPTRQIAQWERRREQQTHLLAKLLSDKESLVARIKNLGVTSKKELMTHGVGRILVEELSELCRQITLVRSDVETLETATEEARSRMRCLERETVLRGTKITDEQYRQMSGTVHVLEELRRTGEPPGSEVRTDKLLDEVFAR